MQTLLQKQLAAADSRSAAGAAPNDYIHVLPRIRDVLVAICRKNCKRPVRRRAVDHTSSVLPLEVARQRAFLAP
jgi:hypothetical protein